MKPFVSLVVDFHYKGREGYHVGTQMPNELNHFNGIGRNRPDDGIEKQNGFTGKTGKLSTPFQFGNVLFRREARLFPSGPASLLS